MGTTRKELEFRCSDDCLQSGCPTHVARVAYESVCDILYFSDGKHIDVSFEKGSLQAFLKLIKELSKKRVEMRNVLEEIKD